MSGLLDSRAEGLLDALDDYAQTLVATKLAVLGADPGGVVDARRYGLKGDQAGDDTEAFRRALEAAREARATLVLPPGSIRLNEPIGLKHGDRIRGRGIYHARGYGTRIYAGAEMPALFWGDDALEGIDNALLADFTLDGEERAEFGLWSVTMRESVLCRVEARQACVDGIQIWGSRGPEGQIEDGKWPGDANRLRLEDVVLIRNGEWGLNLTGSEGDGETQAFMARANNVKASGVVAVKNGAGGIRNHRGASCSFVHCTATDNEGPGWRLEWYSTSLIASTVERNKGPGVEVVANAHTKRIRIIGLHGGGRRHGDTTTPLIHDPGERATVI